ncbi:MAG: hypothetical protein H5T49_05820 [Hadesarchaea archaeon]|nr:hypothetical protein [Hadesarchaea archaeon]
MTASDVVRAMMRAGYPRDEIYDMLVEAGLKGEQAQLLIERIIVEFDQRNLVSRPSRIAAEVSRLFLESFDNFVQEVRSRADQFSLKQDIMRNELEKLKRALATLARQPRTKRK